MSLYSLYFIIGINFVCLQVHLCEAQRITDFIGDDFLVNRTGASRSMMVAVKMLRRNADTQAR